MNLDNLRRTWAKVDAKCSPYWWAFAIAWLLSIG